MKFSGQTKLDYCRALIFEVYREHEKGDITQRYVRRVHDLFEIGAIVAND
jgi:hypothetical protein